MSRMDRPYDPDHLACGRDYPGYPYIYFAAPNPDSLWVTVCVSKCPRAGDTTLFCKHNSVVTSCNRESQISHSTQRLSIYDSMAGAHGLCVPTSQHLREVIAPGIVSESAEIKVREIAQAWPLLLLAIGLCLMLGLMMVYFMRECSGCFVWTVIIASIVGLLTVGMLLMLPQSALHQHTSFISNRPLEIFLGIIFLLLALAVLMTTCSQCWRINLSVRVIECASRFVGGQFSMQMLPLLLFLIAVIFAAVMFLMIAAMFSLGTPPPENTSHQKGHTLPYQLHVLRPGFKVAAWLAVFYTLWGLSFIMDTSTFLVSGTAVNWYFRQDNPHLRARLRFFMYHMGTVLKGSFLGLLFGPLKFISELLSPDPREVNSVVAKCKNILCCMCTYSIFTCYHSGTYSWVQITAQPYCTAAPAVSSLVMRSPASAVVVPLTSRLLHFTGRILAATISCIVTYSIIAHTEIYRHVLYSPTAPLIAVAVLSFVGSSLFLSLYSDAAEGTYVSYMLEADLGGDWNCPVQLKWIFAAINRPYFG